MTWSPLVDFYLDKRTDIEQLIELENRAKKSLAEEVAKFLGSSIEQNVESWNVFRDPKYGVEQDSKDEWYVWWTDKTFHANSVGACFDIYISTKGLLYPDEDEEDRPCIFLEFEGERKGAKRKTLEAAVNRTKSRMIGTPWPDSKNILAYRRLDKVLTFAALLSQEELARAVCLAAKEFSETFAPICATAR